MVNVNKQIFDKRIKELQKVPEKSMQEALPVLKKNTPIDKGNARRSTRLTNKNLTIFSDYPYAGRLDDGYSKQSPKGFTDPTIDALENIVDKIVGRI